MSLDVICGLGPPPFSKILATPKPEAFMSKTMHSQGLFDQMTVTGPFQSLVVKKVIFCLAMVNYFSCSASFIAS